MKRIFYLSIGISLLLGCGPKKVTCIKFPQNRTETCTPTYKLLQNKEWVLDSVIFNGQNITAQTLSRVKDYSFIITDQNQNFTGSDVIVLRSQVFFNDSVFEYQYVSSRYQHMDKGISISPMNEELIQSINNKERPLLLGMVYQGFGWQDYDPDYYAILSLENNKLVYRLDTELKDTMILNYFHSN
jgi:hypothetical protein